MLPDKKYGVQHCKVHKITIHYIVTEESSFNESHCWDCVRDANDKKFKQKAKINKARKQFTEEFSHLWSANSPGGIVSVKIEENEIIVSIETSPDVSNQVPNEYLGFMVSKQIVGEV